MGRCAESMTDDRVAVGRSVGGEYGPLRVTRSDESRGHGDVIGAQGRPSHK